MQGKNWLVYIIHCSDGSYYTGISTDVEKRFEQHKNKKGAKYFYGREPRKIVYIESEHDRSSASKREAEIKNLSHKNKRLLVHKHCNNIFD
jgi:putative endonuclease